MGDHLDNLTRLHTIDPLLTINHARLKGRVGTRAQTNNFLPIIGPLPQEQHYRMHYAKLRDGMMNAKNYPPASYIPRIMVNIGHGSKAFSQSWIGAELLASLFDGTPLPVDNDVFQALHPARFLVKDIHKSRKRS